MQPSKLLETILQKSAEGNSSTFSFTPDAVANSIGKFTYNPEECITFALYFMRCEEIFRNECKTWIDKKKVRLLLRKLPPTEHEKYCNYILPEKTGMKQFWFCQKIFVKKALYSIRDTSV